jgi:hypothetical protein
MTSEQQIISHCREHSELSILASSYFLKKIGIATWMFYDWFFFIYEDMPFYNLIPYSFNIQNLVMKRKYLLNMNVSLCLESSDPSDCVYSAAIFRNTLLPKRPCSMNLDYINPSKIQNMIIVSLHLFVCWKFICTIFTAWYWWNASQRWNSFGVVKLLSVRGGILLVLLNCCLSEVEFFWCC